MPFLFVVGKKSSKPGNMSILALNQYTHAQSEKG
jgi:hypothetical protein